MSPTDPLRYLSVPSSLPASSPVSPSLATIEPNGTRRPLHRRIRYPRTIYNMGNILGPNAREIPRVREKHRCLSSIPRLVNGVPIPTWRLSPRDETRVVGGTANERRRAVLVFFHSRTQLICSGYRRWYRHRTQSPRLPTARPRPPRSSTRGLARWMAECRAPERVRGRL